MSLACQQGSPRAGVLLPATCRAQGSPAGLTLLLQGGPGRQADLGTAEGMGAILTGSPEAVLPSQQTDHRIDSP